MSQTDIETLRQAYEAFSRGDWNAAFAAGHPDLEFKTADRVISPGTYRGREEVTRFFEDLLEPFEEVVAKPQEFFERGDRIVVFVLVRSRPRGSSAVVENRIGHLWTMRDGKVARFEIFPEREKALEAAGLSEPVRKDASAG
jgi:ketosteroid isomerase-like protein